MRALSPANSEARGPATPALCAKAARTASDAATGAGAARSCAADQGGVHESGEV